MHIELNHALGKDNIKNWIKYQKRDIEWVEGRDCVKIPLETAKLTFKLRVSLKHYTHNYYKTIIIIVF